MIVLIPYINLSNVSLIIKCLFLKNTEPLRYIQLFGNRVATFLEKSCQLGLPSVHFVAA